MKRNTLLQGEIIAKEGKYTENSYGSFHTYCSLKFVQIMDFRGLGGTTRGEI
jgi:hypothetical protein